MKVAVLGGGIIGVCTAWWLRQSGHDVELVERRGGPAQETSYANGGQISVSYAEPWASPEAPFKILRWLMRDDAPLLFRPRLDGRQWRWALAFLRECAPGRLVPNIRAMVRMAEYSRDTLRGMRAELGLRHDHREQGILSFYRSGEAFDQSQKVAGLMRDFGVERRVLTPDEVVAIEPALAGQRAQIVGGDYAPDDESGDVYLFACALAERAAQAGVALHYNTQVIRLMSEQGRIAGVEIVRPDGKYDVLRADAYVVALASDSPSLVEPLGMACNVYPAKGYSATFAVRDDALAPTVSLIDRAHKVVMSRLGQRLRLAGTAEIGGYSRELSPARCQMLARLADELFPGALDIEGGTYWAGLRPSTPSNVPLIGRTRLPNLYLNTGHGTLGWTMGAGSGRALADMISGRSPELDFPFLGR